MSRVERRDEDLEATILAGGKGTRLRSAVSDRPKVLAPVCGRPFITWILDQIALLGIKRVVLCTGYMAQKVEETLGDSYQGMNLIHSRENESLDTAGAVRLALDHINASKIMVFNGDSYCQTDLEALVRRHNSVEAKISLLLAGVKDADRYGLVEIDNQNRITRFIEKQQAQGTGLINGGVYLIDRQVLGDLPVREKISFEKDVFPNSIGSRMYGWNLARHFIDIGVPESYAQAEKFFSNLPKNH